METSDFIARLLFCAIPAMPLLVFLLLSWLLRQEKLHWVKRALRSLVLAIPLAALCWAAVLSLVFKHGMGP